MANTLITNWKQATTTRGSYKNFRLGELTYVKHTKKRTYMHTDIQTYINTYMHAYKRDYVDT